ncbi:class A beta-lactamase-related serine hydrolase [Flavobacterium sp.]|uniref:class A beta-lactamase-related serine hydrolase n=1 Tax=Flavobacterium sp. TaxID=239 RepID=UPI002634F8DC|nr:class A beta-lactamase-related serine hydrolase [Flavobacterium sp.]
MKKILILICFFATTYCTLGQVTQNTELYKTILSKDSLLFNVGFNTCDIKQFENLLSDKFEFFHDKDSISNKTTFIYNLKNGLCISPTTYQSRRELLNGSTEIYPLCKGKELYGAIQVGIHKFYETISGKAERFASSAKFTHVWILENGQWKLTKSFSYDHQTEIKNEKQISIFDNDEAIEKWLKENKVPTLGLGIIKNGKLKQVKVFGEISKGVSAPYNTIFNVASLTKPVTAMVALKLASLGKWNIDEPVYKYFTDPDIANDPRNKKITTRIILSHQTGFPNWRWMNENKKLNFLFDPGKGYQYSGEGLEYLRKALENKFKKSLQQLANELIFQPLKMNDTRYIWDKNVDTTRLALGYDREGNAYRTVKNTTPNAADDLLTTIEDYGKFLVSIMNGDGLTKQVFEDMTTNQVATKNGKHFGLGFEMYHFADGNTALTHGGADKGAQTIVFIFPKTKQGLLIFTNVDDGYKVYEKLLLHYLGDYGKQIFEIETK